MKHRNSLLVLSCLPVGLMLAAFGLMLAIIAAPLMPWIWPLTVNAANHHDSAPVPPGGVSRDPGAPGVKNG